MRSLLWAEVETQDQLSDLGRRDSHGWRSNYLHGPGFAKGGRGSGPNFDRLANRTNHCEDRDSGVGRTAAMNSLQRIAHHRLMSGRGGVIDTLRER